VVANFSIGARGSELPIAGVYDDFRIYTRRLSLAEIQTIYACRGTDGIVNGLKNRFIFQAGPAGSAVGTTVRDVGPSGNDFTRVGNPTYTDSRLKFRRRTA